MEANIIEKTCFNCQVFSDKAIIKYPCTLREFAHGKGETYLESARIEGLETFHLYAANKRISAHELFILYDLRGWMVSFCTVSISRASSSWSKTYNNYDNQQLHNSQSHQVRGWKINFQRERSEEIVWLISWANFMGKIQRYIAFQEQANSEVQKPPLHMGFSQPSPVASLAFCTNSNTWLPTHTKSMRRS